MSYSLCIPDVFPRELRNPLSARLPLFLEFGFVQTPVQNSDTIISELQNAIRSGQYVVNPQRIASGLLQDSQALIGAFTATALWGIVRHVLVWYFTTLSKASIVYGSFATAVIMLLSMEIAAALLLLGAQVIAEYERIGQNE